MKQNEGRKFVELEWVCPNCNGVNKGSAKTCQSCGAPQPENVQFRRAANEQYVTDEKKIAMAASGADIHCGFCGTRNPGNAETCSQCGADLKEGKKRAAGQTLQASAAPKVSACSACGAENPSGERICTQCGAPLQRAPQPVAAVLSNAAVADASRAVSNSNSKRNWLIAAGIAGTLLLCCVVLGLVFLLPSKTVQGTVTGLEWQTFVPVQEIQPVNYNDRTGSPPADAYNVSCRTEQEEICTTRMVDQGNGFAEEVQDCHTESTQYCDYTVDEWTTIQTYTLSGADNHPVYDNPTIASDQRIGDRTQELTVYFQTPDGQEIYKPNSVSEFEQFTIGSTWNLTLNMVGGVLSVER